MHCTDTTGLRLSLWAISVSLGIAGHRRLLFGNQEALRSSPSGSCSFPLSGSGYSSDIVDILRRLVGDNDVHVSANAIFALNEILADRGGLEMTKPIVTHLLNRISQYSDFGVGPMRNPEPSLKIRRVGRE